MAGERAGLLGSNHERLVALGAKHGEDCGGRDGLHLLHPRRRPLTTVPRTPWQLQIARRHVDWQRVLGGLKNRRHHDRNTHRPDRREWRRLACRRRHHGARACQSHEKHSPRDDCRINRAPNRTVQGPQQAGSPLGGVYPTGLAGMLPQLKELYSREPRLWGRSGSLAGL